MRCGSYSYNGLLFLIYLDIFFDLLNTLNLLHLRCL